MEEAGHAWVRGEVSSAREAVEGVEEGGGAEFHAGRIGFGGGDDGGC